MDLLSSSDSVRVQQENNFLIQVFIFYTFSTMEPAKGYIEWAIDEKCEGRGLPKATVEVLRVRIVINIWIHINSTWNKGREGTF